MIKCYFVEVGKISSNLPRSNFQESEIEKLSDLILAADGLIRPLILKDTGDEKYTVIDGDLEYYAAVRAKEKNLLKAEEVNAFIVPATLERSATDQLALLAGDRSKNSSISSVVTISVEQLLSTLSSAISPQIQPIVDRLNKHENVLDVLDRQPIDRVSDNISVQLQLILEKLAEHQKILDKLNSKKPKSNAKTPAIVKWIEQIEDRTKLTNTLNLINTLDRNDLTIKMKQSGISNAVKLSTNIIAKRNTQPEQKFDSWEKIVAAKISALGDVTIKKIIENLK